MIMLTGEKTNHHDQPEMDECPEIFSTMNIMQHMEGTNKGIIFMSALFIRLI
jgi:hypothetical protein